MAENAYYLLALGARAVFVALAALISLRAAVYLWREHHSRKRMLRKLPDAGMVGELRDMENDRAYPLPREGVLGSGRGSDIRLKGLRRRLVNFSFVEGKGVLLTRCTRRGEVLLDGAPLGRGAYALHGAVLHAGGYDLRVRLFAGLNVPHPAAFQEHWQPVYEEELYAPTDVPPYPVYTQYTPEESLFSSQRMPAAVPPPEEELPPYEIPPAYTAPAPEVSPVYEAPRRHRRSERSHLQ